jgi:hypothetical protein
MRISVGPIYCTKHCFVVIWFFIVFWFFRRIFIPCFYLFPRPVLVYAAERFVKFIIWWETYWTEYYLYNNRNYWENVVSIKRNGLCPRTTLSNYEYFFARPELC